MTETDTIILEDYKLKLKNIIKREIPLRDPAITVIHCPKNNFQQKCVSFMSLISQLHDEFSEWRYRIINAEELLFSLLDEAGYTAEELFVKTNSRDDLRRDLKSNITKKFLSTIDSEIVALKEQYNPQMKNPPPFLIIINMHACYNFIQTKDLIAEIFNQKGVLVLVLYFQYQDNANFYKEANYNVESIFLADNK